MRVIQDSTQTLLKIRELHNEEMDLEQGQRNEMIITLLTQMAEQIE